MTLNEALSYADRDEFVPEPSLEGFLADSEQYPEYDFSGMEFDTRYAAILGEK